MSDTPKFITVKPKAGLLVRGPDGKPLPEAGDTVPADPWWLRREHDGDVTITTAKAKKDPA